MPQYAGLLPVAPGGAVTLAVAVGDLWTLSTVATAAKGDHGTPPNSTSFPLASTASCAGVALGQEPPYLRWVMGRGQMDRTRAWRAVLFSLSMLPPTSWHR